MSANEIESEVIFFMGKSPVGHSELQTELDAWRLTVIRLVRRLARWISASEYAMLSCDNETT
jgi:hypothetical protein